MTAKRHTLTTLAAVAVLAGCSGGTMLRTGQKAPGLHSIQTIDGKHLSLNELVKKGPVVLVFLRGFS